MYVLFMAKVHTTISVDADIMKTAKESIINISDAAEKGIKERLKIKDVQIYEPEVLKCQFCGKIGKKETAEDIKRDGHFSSPDRLTWLWPDERWICNSCLRFEIRKVKV